ncbi:MAG: hypothetical protein LBB23_03995 [Rickettsiales bacterium]|jgi:hypothetical protein|nr:hypothetical protein [Rickettsiales bacterium]
MKKWQKPTHTHTHTPIKTIRIIFAAFVFSTIFSPSFAASPNGCSDTGRGDYINAYLKLVGLDQIVKENSLVGPHGEEMKEYKKKQKLHKDKVQEYLDKLCPKINNASPAPATDKNIKLFEELIDPQNSQCKQKGDSWVCCKTGKTYEFLKGKVVALERGEKDTADCPSGQVRVCEGYWNRDKILTECVNYEDYRFTSEYTCEKASDGKRHCCGPINNKLEKEFKDKITPYGAGGSFTLNCNPGQEKICISEKSGSEYTRDDYKWSDCGDTKAVIDNKRISDFLFNEDGTMKEYCFPYKKEIHCCDAKTPDVNGNTIIDLLKKKPQEYKYTSGGETFTVHTYISKKNEGQNLICGEGSAMRSCKPTGKGKDMKYWTPCEKPADPEPSCLPKGVTRASLLGDSSSYDKKIWDNICESCNATKFAAFMEDYKKQEKSFYDMGVTATIKFCKDYRDPPSCLPDGKKVEDYPNINKEKWDEVCATCGKDKFKEFIDKYPEQINDKNLLEFCTPEPVIDVPTKCELAFFEIITRHQDYNELSKNDITQICVQCDNNAGTFNKSLEKGNKLADACKEEKPAPVETLADLSAFQLDSASWLKKTDGTTNVKRLAFDASAAVAVGALGGFITNHFVKAHQVDKGFESVQCKVAGSAVAGWGDQVSVGSKK